MDTSLDIVKINKYIDGELKGASLESFEELLKTNKVLAEEIKFQQDIYKSLKAKSEFENEKKTIISFINDLEQNTDIANVEQERVEELLNETNIKTDYKKPIFRKLLPFVSLAAAAAILFFLFGPQFNNISPAQLADNNFEPYVLATFMDDASKLEANYRDGKLAYDDGKYEASLNYFDAYLLKKPDIQTVQLAKGSAEFKLERFDAAISTFNEIAKTESLLSDDANWYLALCSLKKDDKNAAATYLKKIGANSNYKQQAAQLLKKL